MPLRYSTISSREVGKRQRAPMGGREQEPGNSEGRTVIARIGDARDLTRKRADVLVVFRHKMAGLPT
jgi:hypothetical protein